MSKNPENKCFFLLNKTNEVKYDENALGIMLKMQYELQKFYNEKRGSITPDYPNKERVKESLYHFNCFIAEIWEFDQRTYNIKNNEDLIELQFELIDAWHFLMNMILYLGYRENDFNNLDFYWNEDMKIIDYKKIIGEISIKWGQILDYLPYKYWKTYSDYDFDKEKVKIIIEIIMKYFFNICKQYKITKEFFYKLYVAKNKENYDRQKRGY